jgi:molybdopterin/thiamine biosynthesis adenylyltransferase
MLGTIQATEVLKYLTGTGDLLTNRLLTFNAKKMEFRTIKVKHNNHCAICGDHPSITELIDYEQATCDITQKN